ncbi:MAG: hypothetical protein GF375_02565, partial [Candidatus Omnitrophica bacterium]|nr:hypothetical protein [Candidatus Omnitrophota bacterium]MBD3268985.1 hypothetical protein [Candidatus Omnitrophota bacterium]
MKKEFFFYTAVFTGSFLLFQIQPIISKMILPLFGGSYLVWATCLVFFQAFLLLGYLYAHLGQRILGVRNFALVHVFLLFSVFFFFSPQIQETSRKFLDWPLPAAVFVILLLKVGLPFLLLSAGSLIIQSWYYVSTTSDNSPYFLYGTSNAGSLLALASYPFLIEPLLNIGSQIAAWRSLYLSLIVFYFFCFPYRPAKVLSSNLRQRIIIEDRKKITVWFFLSMAPACLLTSTTNIITFDIPPVPLLWIMPLGIYILTFILTFRKTVGLAGNAEIFFRWIIPVGAVFYLLSCLHLSLPSALFIFIALSVLFIVGFACHGKLVSLKPEHESSLTLFYVIIAMGGICGSFIAGIIMPLVTDSLLEYPFSLFLAAAAFALAIPQKEDVKPLFLRQVFFVSLGVVFFLLFLPGVLSIFFSFKERTIFVFSGTALFILLRCISRSFRFLSLTMLLIVILFPWIEGIVGAGSSVEKFRNFYGIYRIYDKEGQRFLEHGSVIHGRQYLDKERICAPAGYYHSSTPAGEIFTSEDFTLKDIAMIGLGSGALLAHLH